MAADLQPTTALHPPADELVAFSRGALDEVRAAVLEGHVYKCHQCAEVIAVAPEDDFVGRLRNANRQSPDNHVVDGLTDQTGNIGVPIADAHVTELPNELRQHPRYLFQRLIAEGSMGRVYLCQDRKLGRAVAVKVLRPDLAADERKQGRFRQEAQIACQLRHRNIARVFRGATIGQATYLAMEYVPGKSIAQVVMQRGPLPVTEICQWMSQAALGLAYAAERRVVHRDIKPANLMINHRARELKILDFGLGRIVDEERSTARLTKEGEILGTLAYLSPEQAAAAQDADARSDIYSLGCTMYYMLIGAPPFDGRNPVDLLRKHESAEPPWVRCLRGDVPASVADLVSKMLEKEPRRRPAPAQLSKMLAASRARDAPNGNTTDSHTSRLRQWGRPEVFLPTATSLGCFLWLAVR